MKPPRQSLTITAEDLGKVALGNMTTFLEEWAITHAINLHKGCVKEAAYYLKVERTTFSGKMKKYGIQYEGPSVRKGRKTKHKPKIPEWP